MCKDKHNLLKNLINLLTLFAKIQYMQLPFSLPSPSLIFAPAYEPLIKRNHEETTQNPPCFTGTTHRR